MAIRNKKNGFRQSNLQMNEFKPLNFSKCLKLKIPFKEFHAIDFEICADVFVKV